VELFRELATANPSYQTSLGSTLVNLGGSFQLLGRTDEAIAALEEAASAHRQASAQSYGKKELLAEATRLLTEMLMRCGSPERALDPAEQTAAAYEELAASSPSYGVKHALAVTTLANVYRGLGRPHDAVEEAEKGVSIARAQITGNDAKAALLGWTLTVLVSCLYELGRYSEALPLAEEAMRLFRQLNAAGGDFRESHARCLVDLGNIYQAIGRLDDALTVTGQAVTIWNELTAVDARYRREWAIAAGNVGLYHRDAERFEEALTWIENAIETLRVIAEGDDRLQLELARTLLNSVSVYIELERFEDALAAIEEAVAFYESSASAPVYLLQIGGALSNLSACLRSVGRIYEAVDPAERSVSIFEQLANVNQARVHELATALTNLESLMTEIGDLNQAEYYWTQAISHLSTDELRVGLLVARASVAPLGDTRAAGWLVDAIGYAHGDLSIEVSIRKMCRHHRACDPDEWDTAWHAIAAEPPPLWMMLEEGLVEDARRWAQMPDSSSDEEPLARLKNERDFLSAHMELLEDAGTLALDEALLLVSESKGALKRTVLETAKTAGAEAAYWPLILNLEFQAFAATELDGQRSILEGHPSHLLDDLALQAISQAGLTTPQEIRGHALLAIATHASAEEIGSIFSALEDVDQFPALFKQFAARPNAVELLSMTATVARTASDSEETEGLADVFAAVAAAMAGNKDEVVRLVASAVRLGDPQLRDTWIAHLAELAATVPSALPVITALVSGHST
jgi:tetratricopeptide (TPR) repeat protein